MALAQIGEFSFILAALGRDLGVLTDAATNTLVAASIVSISLNPLAVPGDPAARAWVSRRPSLCAAARRRAARRGRGATRPRRTPRVATIRHRAVVVGYGPVGRTVTRLLRENEIEPTVIELNMETVRRLREEGVDAVYGDAPQLDTLRAAGVDHAASLILSADMADSREVIRLARELNPTIRVLARTAYLREAARPREAGANAVFAGEGEVALALTEAILSRLGATPEQIDRERSRVRAELFG